MPSNPSRRLAPRPTTTSHRLTVLAVAGAALFAVGAAPAGGAGPAASLLYPYFEVDLADAAGDTTSIAVGNASSQPVVAHLTLWTDWGLPTYAFDVFLAGDAVHTFNLRHLFAGIVPESTSGGALGCAETVAVPPLDAAALRAAHTGQPLPSSGLCAGSGRRGDEVATGFVTVDTAHQCSNGTLLFPTDPQYFDSGLVDPPDPFGAHANVLFGDLLFLDLAGDNVQALEAVPLVAETDLASEATFYQALGRLGSDDRRRPLAAKWTSRFLQGGPVEPSSRLLLWRGGAALDEPIECGMRFVDSCHGTSFLIRDEAGELVAAATAMDELTEVTALYPVGEAPLSSPVPYGTVTAESIDRRGCGIGTPNPDDFRPLQSFAATLTEAEGRLSFAFRGTPHD